MRGLVIMLFICTYAISGREVIREVRETKLYRESMRRDHIDKFLGRLDPKAKLYLNGIFIQGDRKDPSTEKNNLAITSIITRNDYEQAKQALIELRKSRPGFFPARYNLGLVFLRSKDYHHAVLEFRKARDLCPQYSMNYYYLGQAYMLQGDYDNAMYNFRIAYLRNPYDMSSLVALADLLIFRKRLTEAKDVFQYCLEIDDGYNNALIGMGKIAFHHKKYYDATLWFRAVDTTNQYKKELHYHYARAAFFSRNYKLAVKQYEEMLRHPTDRIFDTVSITRARFNLRLAQQLAFQKVSAEN